MSKPLRNIAGGLVLALVVCWESSAAAQLTGERARQFIGALGDEVIAVLKDPSLDTAGRKKALHDIFLRSFDAKAMARFSLGRYWRTATADQKARYMALFPTYVADIYAGRLSTYAGETFAVTLARVLDSRRALVNAEIRRPDGTATKVDFRVQAGPDGLKTTDVVVESVSLLVTKRDEFASVIGRRGVNGLIDMLQRFVER